MAKLRKYKHKQFRADERIVDAQGRPTIAFVRFINDLIKETGSRYDDLAEAFDDLAITQEDGATEKSKNSIALSYVSPAQILSAAASPADNTKACITIATHTRFYSDGTKAVVNGGSVDLLPYATTYHVFYDQTERNGGDVVYNALTGTTAFILAAQTGLAPRADRHACGSIITPASSAAGTTFGNGPKPTGV